jgi:hypothetical protein
MGMISGYAYIRIRVYANGMGRKNSVRKNIFSMCPLIYSAVIEFSLSTSGNPKYLSTTMRK